jgi:hypothetical protein
LPEVVIAARQSVFLGKVLSEKVLSEDAMDARIKSGHDGV